MGTPEFAVESLKRIHHSKHSLLAVVTSPDKPAGRGMKLRQSAVKEYCVLNDIPCLQPEKLKDPEFIANLKKLDAEAFVVIAFRMLPQEIWSMPRKGTINIHASLLPDYRGAAPINHAIIQGEQVTGVSSFIIEKEIDTGDILLQKSCKIVKNETAGELHDKLKILGADLIIETLDGLENGKISGQKQAKPANQQKIAPKLTTINTKINFGQSAQQVFDFCRGLSPFPGAWCGFKQGDNESTLKIFKIKILDNAPSTTIRLDPNGLIVPCLDANILLEEVQPAGKRRMSGGEFARGIQISRGNPEVF